jgi:hypothetical protein
MGYSRKKLNKTAVTLAALAGATLASPSFADALQSMANQRSSLPGSRAALMGGAFTAVADDSSASFYNPAGLSQIKENRLELSATSYRASELVYHQTVNEEPFQERSEQIHPSFVGGTSKFGWLTLGYSFMSLDARNIYQQDSFENISEVEGVTNTYSRTYQESSTYIWAGGSASIRLSDTLSFGSSFFYYQRNIKFTANEIVSLNGGGIININDTLDTVNTGASNVTGFLWKKPMFALGLSVKSARATSDKSTLHIDRIDFVEGDSTPNHTSTTISHKALNELNPTTYNAGVAFKPTSWFLVSADAHLHEGVKSPYKPEGGHDLHSTIDYSIGTAIGGDTMTVMAGYFTNNSMFRSPDPNFSGQPLWINYIGKTFGLSWNFSGLRGQIGYVHQTGAGKAQIRSGDPDIQNVDGTVETVVVGGTVPL